MTAVFSCPLEQFWDWGRYIRSYFPEKSGEKKRKQGRKAVSWNFSGNTVRDIRVAGAAACHHVFFYEIPLWGIFMNLLILPTAGILLASGILGCVLGVWFPVLGKIAAFPAAGILELYLQTGKITAGLPGALWITGQPKLWKCALYYVLLVLVLWLRKGDFISAYFWQEP